MKPRVDAPQAVVLTLMLVAMGSLLLLQLLMQQDLYFINKFFLDHDYDSFYNASVFVSKGGSPYIVPGYVMPPLAAFLNVPLTSLPFAVARVLVSLGSFVAMMASLLIVHRNPQPSRPRP